MGEHQRVARGIIHVALSDVLISRQMGKRWVSNSRSNRWRTLKNECHFALTALSSPVRYPRLSLSVFIDPLSPCSAASKSRYQPSINSFVYSLEAPKSISWIWSVEDRYRKLAQLGSVCMNRKWNSSWRQSRRMLVPIYDRSTSISVL